MSAPILSWTQFYRSTTSLIMHRLAQPSRPQYKKKKKSYFCVKANTLIFFSSFFYLQQRASTTRPLSAGSASLASQWELCVWEKWNEKQPEIKQRSQRGRRRRRQQYGDWPSLDWQWIRRTQVLCAATYVQYESQPVVMFHSSSAVLLRNERYTTSPLM